MISGVVVCPHPLLLLTPNRCVVDPIADLRAACLDALLRLPLDPLVLVGSVDAHRSSPPRIRDKDPLSLRVGRALLRHDDLVSPRRKIVADTGRDELAEIVASPTSYVALMMADGSARRAESGGPGTFDPRAAAYDEQIAAALVAGDPAALGALDRDEADELMVAGAAAFAAMSVLPKPVTAELRYAEAPFGVGYFVAQWSY